MRTAATSASELYATGRRLDASFHASDSVRTFHHIHRWAAHARPLNNLRETPASYYAGNIDKPPVALMNARRLDTLAQVCRKDGILDIHANTYRKCFSSM